MNPEERGEGVLRNLCMQFISSGALGSPKQHGDGNIYFVSEALHCTTW